MGQRRPDEEPHTKNRAPMFQQEAPAPHATQEQPRNVAKTNPRQQLAVEQEAVSRINYSLVA